MHRITGRFLSQASFWIAALIVGVLSVLYAELIEVTQNIYLSWFHARPYWISIGTPLLFVSATAIIRIFAPEARGSGIPQVLRAIEKGGSTQASEKLSDLVSLKTAGVKVFSTTLGILAGASVGREGPTVQIAATVFSWIANRTKRFFSGVDYQAYLVAGGAAGVAAAFNTPIAGIAFALEEIGETKFPKFKENVMLSVIIAGIAAQALAGNYLYFGHPVLESPPARIVLHAILIGGLGGVAGSLFSRILCRPTIVIFPKHWMKRALICGVLCSFINLFTHGASAGSGYEATRHLMDSSGAEFSIFFFFEKFATTILSYLSGMAGGIFSPCLSIGAGLGVLVSTVCHLGGLKICALIGMVAFFAGVVQAPLTAVIIVMEMTDKHILIIPLMVSAYLAQIVAKQFMPVSLYRSLAFGQENIIKSR